MNDEQKKILRRVAKDVPGLDIEVLIKRRKKIKISEIVDEIGKIRDFAYTDTLDERVKLARALD